MPRIIRPDPKKITDYFKPNKETSRSLHAVSKDSFATILDIPNELLLAILDYFRWGSDYYHILRELDLVCRKFSLVFLPLVRTSHRCNNRFGRGLQRAQEIKDNRYGKSILDIK
jgi:hypothetical protein